MKTPRPSQGGYTLAELLVALALIGMTLAGVLTLLMSSQQSYLIGVNQVEAQQSARLALERMVREIREAGHCPTCQTAAATSFAAFDAVTAISSTSFTIQNDFNATWNGATGIETSVTASVNGTTRGEQITYSVSGTNLRRQESAVDASPQVVIDRVAQLGSTAYFQYFDVNDSSTTVAANVRSIVVTLKAMPPVEPGATSAGHAEVVVTDRIRLRNR